MRSRFKGQDGFTPLEIRSDPGTAGAFGTRFLTGFTLIEVVMTIAIFTMIAYGLIALVSNIYTTSTGQASLLAGADQARKVAFNFTNELRNASTSNTGAYPIGLAEEQQLIFYSNLDQSPDVEKIRYFVENGKLHKGLTKPTGNPVTYNPALETRQAVQDDFANGAAPLFYYYDGTYDGTTDNYLPQPVNINQVKFIKIKLMVYKKAGLVNLATYTVTDGATIRNLKTNLGE